MRTLPKPPAPPLVGHLWQWVSRPLPLLERGARTGGVFRLRLWRPTVVGYRPEWNRAVLGDLDTFRSRGSLTGLTPYLAGGVIHTDVPRHTARRRVLNPHFHSRAVANLAHTLRVTLDPLLPVGDFDAVTWSSTAVRRMLNVALFGGRLSDRLLAAFLAPLDRYPSVLLPRPWLFSRVTRAIRSVVMDPPAGSITAAVADTGSVAETVEELRVALAAGYDTTAHSLAWALWHLAAAPRWRDTDLLPTVIDEVLRLYPTGWLGSRVTSRDTTVAGVALPAGTLVLYSPYLTHRDPELWREPHRFQPERFADGRPAWGYLPFAAGRRTCLGTHLARLMVRTALTPFCGTTLTQVGGDPTVEAGITLRPRGPLRLRRVVTVCQPSRQPTAGQGRDRQ